MNDILEQAPAPNSGSEEVRELRNVVAGLKKLLTIALLLLLVLTGSYNLIAMRLMLSARKDLNTVQPKVSAMVQQYETVQGPIIQSFYSNLIMYAKSHPQFTPVLIQNGVINPGK
ncbi:MAG: hypothetical protein JWN25_3260 [Verrucomicrobiales bacterium]|nr:hypothetical protein [Verrucomicrobiales bacterium]MDB6131669.1 hypothetical protein [Verrucomicrobiales bacterium]